MLSISPIADADYYLGGSGGACCVRTKASPADYELDAVTKGEPPGRWAWRGENRLGLTGEIHAQGASGDAFRLLLNELRDPTRPKGEDGQHPRLGRAPQKFKTVDERVAAYERKHPGATPEEVAAFRMSAQADQRQANNAWDLVFSPPKSWSVLHAALQWAGRHDEAEALWECLEVGVGAALTELHEHLAYIQSKPTGPSIGGQRAAAYEAAQNLQMATWRHHSSRDGDPQLHVHVTMLNRVLDGQGRWRALYSPALLRSKHGLDALFLRVAEGAAARRLGYSFVATPDGVSREIEGVSPEVRGFFSSRSRALTEEAQRLVDAFTASRGRAPTQRERWRMLQHATKDTRRAKEKSPAPREEQLERWEEAVRRETRASLADVIGHTDGARVEPGAELVVPVFDPDAVIEQALAWLDQSKAVWSVSHLRSALDRHMPAMLAETDVPGLFRRLVERAVAHPSVVAVEAKPAVPVPVSLMDAKRGQARTEAPDPRKFTTRATLEREASLVARLDVLGAPSVAGDRARDLVAGSGLSQEQDAAVVGMLTSGRWLEVVDAAAGTGKSTTGRALSAASQQQWGIGVTGFTVAENPARVLRRQGMERAHNIAQFRVFREREARGEVSDWERARYAVAPGSVVWIDEASTVDTATLVWLVGELYAVGVGKVVLVGDREQADPVDAGGAFAMLVDELEHRRQQAARAATEQQAQHRAAHLALPPSQRAEQAAAMAAWTEPAAGATAAEPVLEPVPVHRLRQVRRFDQGWERAASARLREGDSTALHQYETRERLHGASDADELREIAVAGFVDDWLAGHDSIIVTSTTEEASAAASQVRQRLVEAGHVERDGVDLRDNTTAGIGDMIETRENDRTVGAVNRQRWQVVGRADSGSLEVREELDRNVAGDAAWGPVHTLPASYVRTQVELAYAGTVHAVEGTTITGSATHRGTSWTIVTRSMGRSHAYVGATRATGENHLVVQVAPHPPLERARAQVSALEHKHCAATTAEQRASIETALAAARAEVAAALPHAETPAGRLAAVVAADDHLPSARTALAIEEDRATHLGHLGPEWELRVRETRAAAHRQMLVDALGPIDAAVVLADPAVSRLYGLLRGAELSGHEPGEALEACAARGSLATARFPAAAMYARLADEMATGPLARPVPLGFEARTPKPSRGDVENERLLYAAELGRVMDRRATELAERAALDQPTWAVRALGPVPDEPDARAAWVGRVALACAYRERYDVGDDERTVLGRRPPHAEPERGWLWDTAARLIGMPEHERNLAGLSDGELANREQQWQRALGWMPRNVDADLRVAHTAAQEAQHQLVEALTAGQDPARAQADVEEMTAWVASLEEVAAVRAEAIEVCAGVRDRALDAQRERERREEIEAARAGHLHPDDPGPEEPDEPEDEADALDEPQASSWSALDALEAVWEHLQQQPQEPGDVPRLGSWAWADLEDADPAKWAAVEASALAWFRAGEPFTAAQVRAENARLNEARAEIGVDDGVDADRMFAVARYAGPKMTGPAPTYGSREWAQLEPGDPARARAVLDAGLAEWNAGDVALSDLAAAADAAEDKVSAIRVSQEVQAQNAARGWDRRSEHQVQRDRALADAEVERQHGEPERAAAAEARAADAVEHGEAQTRRIEEPVPELDGEPEPEFDRERYAATLGAARAAQDAEPAPAAVVDPEPRNQVVDEDHAADPEPADDVDEAGERRQAEREARDAELAEQVAKAREAADVLAAMRAREVEDELRAHEQEMQRSLEVQPEVEPEVEVDA